MADNFIQPGDVLTTANDTGATISSGDPCIVFGGIRIAINDIADGASGPAYDAGVIKLTAKASDTWSDGDRVYWDNTEEELTATADDNFFAGYASGDKAAAATTANVKLSKCCVATTTTA